MNVQLKDDFSNSMLFLRVAEYIFRLHRFYGERVSGVDDSVRICAQDFIADLIEQRVLDISFDGQQLLKAVDND